ncbi:ribonuclease H1 isoform X2 [Octopus sinensis]|uniref:Ribonuclease H1 n=1 Tax=Octopus sinensis TaxID=2607531 RepID=A0A7E6FAF4_9MOLL|nr:ribonuclease H1 isoform X2 [Octopus sinensis]
MTSVLVAGLLRRPTSILNTLKPACCLDNFIVMPFYAVKKGRVPGVYETWTECQEQINGFYGAKFKKFSTEEEALAFAEIPASDKTLSSVAKSIMLADLDDSEESKEFSTLACNVENDLAKLTISNKPAIDSKLLTGTTSSEDASESPEKKKSVEEGGFTGKKFADDDGVVVFTDGCCFHNGKHGASAGLGVYWGDGEKNTSERLGGRQTNNRAEIYAAIRAVEQAKAKKISNLIIKTDSQFLINCITKWLEGWKKKNWMKSSGEEVTNKEELQELDKKLEGINVKWVHVDKCCAGIEAAEQLAKKEENFLYLSRFSCMLLIGMSTNKS